MIGETISHYKILEKILCTMQNPKLLQDYVGLSVYMLDDHSYGGIHAIYH